LYFNSIDFPYTPRNGGWVKVSHIIKISFTLALYNGGWVKVSFPQQPHQQQRLRRQRRYGVEISLSVVGSKWW